MQPGPWGVRYLMTARDDDRTREQASRPEELPGMDPDAWAAWARTAPSAGTGGREAAGSRATPAATPTSAPSSARTPASGQPDRPLPSPGGRLHRRRSPTVV